MSPRKPKATVTVVVVAAKCIECGHRWDVGPGEVPNGQMPECPKCGMFGVATSARVAKRREKKT